ncbi:MAG: hypothetical protein WC224_05005 [Sphaerochaetaceae bacterium]
MQFVLVNIKGQVATVYVYPALSAPLFQFIQMGTTHSTQKMKSRNASIPCSNICSSSLLISIASYIHTKLYLKFQIV